MTIYIEPHEFEPRSRDPQECRRCYSSKAHHPFNLEEKSSYRPGWHAARPYERESVNAPASEIALLVGGILLVIAAVIINHAATLPASVIAVVAVFAGISCMFAGLHKQGKRFKSRR